MAPHLALLIAAALLRAAYASPAPPQVAAASSCVSCHGTHAKTPGACEACHRGNPRMRRASLAHERLLTGAAAAWGVPGCRAVREGERLRDALGCRRCHVSGGTGNAFALSLDAIAWRREQRDLRASILRPATFMPDFSLTPGQADALIAVLLRDGDRAGGESRYLVRFRRGPAPGPGAFATRCGGCHRALTHRGPLGTSASGPNLTGLLGPWYPASDGRRWDRARLERWLRDPRADRPGTSMLPVALKPGEFDEIVETLAAPAR